MSKAREDRIVTPPVRATEAKQAPGVDESDGEAGSRSWTLACEGKCCSLCRTICRSVPAKRSLYNRWAEGVTFHDQVIFQETLERSRRARWIGGFLLTRDA